MNIESYLPIRKSMFQVVIISIGCVLVAGILVVASVFESNESLAQSGTSIEVGLAEMSPRGREGGYAVPASAAATAPTVTLYANPAIVNFYRKSVLTWQSTNADACVATGGWSGAKGLSGVETTQNITAQTTFTITCSRGTNTAVRNATVRVNPNMAPSVPSIVAANTVCVNASTTVEFTSTDPDSPLIGQPGYITEAQRIRYGLDRNGDSIRDKWVPVAVPVSAAASQSVIEAASGYVLSGISRSADFMWTTPGVYTVKVLAQDQFGSSSQWASKSITVSNTGSCAPSLLPVVSLTATPPIVNLTESSVLSWTATNGATQCDIIDDSVPTAPSIVSDDIAYPAVRTLTVTPTSPRSYLYKAECTNPSGVVGSDTTVIMAQSTCTYSSQCVGDDLVTQCPSATLVDGCKVISINSISAVPNPVRIKDKTHIIWTTAEGLANCSVSGGGDTWTETTGDELSSPLVGQTTYTLSCDGVAPMSVTVKIIPGFTEI